MANVSKLSQRFDELASQLQEIEKSKRYHEGSIISGDVVDGQDFISWTLKARHLVTMACGEGSLHAKRFAECERNSGYQTNYDVLKNVQAVFDAAREDFEGGYCTTIRTFVQAEVFDSELDQAKALCEGSYHTAAAVIAGVVLETTLRQLCDNQSIPHSKLDKMNADLAKAGQYNALKAKQVTAWAAIRNAAAHGHPEQFTADDVRDMVKQVGIFVGEQL